jgi:hypothetical protein
MFRSGAKPVQFDTSLVVELHERGSLNKIPRIISGEPVRNFLTTKCGHNYSGHSLINRCRNLERCEACLKHHTQFWTMRCGAEGFTANFVLFGTLTYADEHLKEGVGHNDNDFKNYMSNIRIAGRKKGYKVKYLACFEFGSKTGRPHYHVILFFTKTRENMELPKWPLYVRANLPHWNKGFSQYETPKSDAGIITYTLGYMAKKGGRLLRPSNGIGKQFLLNYAAFLARNRMPLFKDQFGVRVRIPNMRTSKRSKVNLYGEKNGRMVAYLLPTSHAFIPEMARVYLAEWKEVHGSFPPDRWFNQADGDWDEYDQESLLA